MNQHSLWAFPDAMNQVEGRDGNWWTHLPISEHYPDHVPKSLDRNPTSELSSPDLPSIAVENSRSMSWWFIADAGPFKGPMALDLLFPTASCSAPWTVS